MTKALALNVGSVAELGGVERNGVEAPSRDLPPKAAGYRSGRVWRGGETLFRPRWATPRALE